MTTASLFNYNRDASPDIRIVMGGVDPRPTCYVLMAGTPRFPDWYLYYPELEGEPRET